MSLTVTLACEHVRLCRCPADAGRRHSYLQADWPSDWSSSLPTERMTSAEKKKVNIVGFIQGAIEQILTDSLILPSMNPCFPIKPVAAVL